MKLTLPYPPSINHYWRHVGAKVLISREGREFRELVGLVCKLERVKGMPGPLSLTIEVYPPDKRRRDIDNLMKSVLDSLQHGGAYEDDSQIVRLLVVKREVERAGRVTVTIEEAEGR